MITLSNNRVYILDLNPLRALYHGHQNTFVFNKVGVVASSATFDEDLRAVINVLNGLLSEEGLLEYAHSTPYATDLIDNYSERELLVSNLQEEIIRRIWLLIPEYRPGGEIYTYWEGNLIYVIDLRRNVRVPEKIYHLHQQRSREQQPCFCEELWDDGYGY